jgi:DNA-binding GntR family transcriptional regulator
MMQDGRSKADLAQMFGVSEITIDRALQRLGLAERRQI